MATKGNKGEWSEFYAFLKVITDGRIFAGDKDQLILVDKYFTVVRVSREDGGERRVYDISKGNGMVSILDKDGHQIDCIPLASVKRSVTLIFDEMRKAKGHAFELATAEGTMKTLSCGKIKASNAKKADLTIVIEDSVSSDLPELGFSVKSMLGAPSTLLNASGGTNFVFRVVGITVNQAETANAFTGKARIRKMVDYLVAQGGSLEYVKMSSEVFRRNLRRIETALPEVVAEMLKHYYSGEGARLVDIVEQVSKNKHLCGRLEMSQDDYVYKVKSLLSAVALGLTPQKEWEGRAAASGGYIIVRGDGEVVCYHLYNRNEFEDYLFHNTKFDTPSTSRHNFGRVYREGDELRLDLNLQIRFIR